MYSKFLAPLLLLAVVSTSSYSEAVNPFKSNAKLKAAASAPAAPLVAVPTSKPELSASSPVGQTLTPPLTPPTFVAPPAPLGGLTPPPVLSDASADAKDSAPVDKDAPFMTREALDAKRAACRLTLDGATVRQVGVEESEIALKFTKNSGTGCLSAVLFEGDWLHAQIDSLGNEIRVSVAENTTTNSRQAVLQVLAGDQTFRVRIKQIAAELPPE